MMAATGKRTAKTTTKRATSGKAATTTPVPGKRSATKRAARGSDPSHYTQPALRDRLKAQILAGDQGGHPGQWSARKAQLLAHAYETAGGGYHGGKSPAQRHLDQWTHEAWTTADGQPAQRGDTTARYLPQKAWDALTPAERHATDKKKRAASKTGRQFVANTARAADARRQATEHEAPPADAAPHTPLPAKRATAKRAPTKRAPAKRARP